ncbi:MAG: hypothetical protein ACO25K_07800 [Candidatus Fonsibacter ubiquis]
MATLNTSYGWTQGDQVRLLVASGLTVGTYQIDQITVSMNELGSMSTDAVGAVLDLMDQFETAQTQLATLNNDNNGKVLVKADVLEWEQAKSGNNYNPQMEILRIRGLLYQYMAMCPLYVNISMGTMLYRS